MPPFAMTDADLLAAALADLGLTAEEHGQIPGQLRIAGDGGVAITLVVIAEDVERDDLDMETGESHRWVDTERRVVASLWSLVPSVRDHLDYVVGRHIDDDTGERTDLYRVEVDDLLTTLTGVCSDVNALDEMERYDALDNARRARLGRPSEIERMLDLLTPGGEA